MGWLSGKEQTLRPEVLENQKLSHFVGSTMESEPDLLKKPNRKNDNSSNLDEESITEGTHEVSQDLCISKCDDGEGINGKQYLIEASTST